MGCGQKTVTPRKRDFECPEILGQPLRQLGRLHFFYHSKDSPLPVRDVLNRHRQGNKTEPYLEKRAENYCQPCIQNNIRGFLKSKEKYLFLLTRHSGPGSDGKRYVVGYLEKERCLRRSHTDKS